MVISLAASANPSRAVSAHPRFRRPTFMSTPQTGPRKSNSWLLAFALLLVAGGCVAAFFFLSGGEAERGPGDEYSARDQTSNSQTQPTGGDWKSEQLADAADTQLKKLAALLDSGTELETTSIQPLVIESVQGSPMRPLRFEERFQTPSLSIRRGVDLKSVSNYRGASRLADAMNRKFQSPAFTQWFNRLAALAMLVSALFAAIMTTNT